MYTYLLVNMAPSQDKIKQFVYFLKAHAHFKKHVGKKVYLGFNKSKNQIKFCSQKNTNCGDKDAPLEGMVNFDEDEQSYIIRYFPPGYKSQDKLALGFRIKKENNELKFICLEDRYKVTSIEPGKKKSDFKITIEKFREIGCLKF